MIIARHRRLLRRALVRLFGQQFPAHDLGARTQGIQLAAGDLTRQGAMPQLVDG